jgi:outer membrane protein insertion porin family
MFEPIVHLCRRLQETSHRTPLVGCAVLVLIGWITSGCTFQQTKDLESGGESSLASVRRIAFSGNEQFAARTLRSVMATQTRSWWKPWKRGDPYNPETLQADLLRLRKYYFDRGFLRTSATISEVKEDFQSGTVSIHIDIEEGPLTRLRSVRLMGTIPSQIGPRQRLLATLPLKPETALNKVDFDTSQSKLLLKMQDAGYARAAVIPKTEVTEDGYDADVTFRLIPGEPTSFGRVTITGEHEVPEYVLRRELTVEEGQPYSLKELRDSEQNLYSLGMFRAVTARVPNLKAGDGPVGVDFEVIERKPRTVELGIGASSLESFRYQMSWTHRNIFGEAEQFSAFAKVSGIQQQLEVSLFEPYVFTRRNSLRYKLFAVNNQNIDTDPLGILENIFDIVDPYPAYDFVTVGGELRLERDFTKKLRGTLGLDLSANKYYNIDRTADPSTLEGAEDNILFIQDGGVEWNTRNDDLNPTSGLLVRGGIQHSNSNILSDVSFGKLSVEGRYYLSLPWRSVLATRLKLGGIEPYAGSASVPSNVRFFAGGAGSVRGFANNRLGPLDTDGNPIGGNSLIEGSLELRFRVTRTWGGVAFIDFGNVFPPAFTYRLTDLRYTGGAGIRYFTPVGPLRLDVAVVLDSREGDQTAPFYFSIGQAF